MNPDPLFVVNPKVPCPACRGDRDRKLRRGCKACQGSGYLPVNLNGLWAPAAAFLVCGGPSILKQPWERLRERGVASLAINQVAAKVPVTAWTFGDPAEKFHHGLHFDPKMLTFAPLGKLRHPLNVKLPDGSFRQAALDKEVGGKLEAVCLRDCPGVFGFSRDSVFDPPTFLTDPTAHWGGKTRQQIDYENAHPEIKDKAHPEHNRTKHEHVLCSMLLGFRLLHYLGCPRIYLMGVDMWMTDDQPYAFEQAKKARNGRYQDETEMLRQLKPVFDAEGFQVFNTNPDSKCGVFPHESFDEALEDCRGAVPREPFDTAKWYEKSEAEQQIKANPEIKLSAVAKLQREAKQV